MYFYSVCCAMLGFSLYGTYAEERTFFRKDYTYLDQTKSFYKFHTVPRNWQDAKKRCSLEGATLFYPYDDTEAEVVMTLWNNTQPFYYVFLGISDYVVKGVFETVDGFSIDDVYNKWGPGEPNDAGGKEGCVVLSRLNGLLNDDVCEHKFPFICKKTQESLVWNNNCNLPDPKYKYSSSLNRCYKYHAPANWTDAHTICRTEQSHLAVINSQEEADFLVKFIEEQPKSTFMWTYFPGIAFLGFHNRFEEEGWKTVTGQALEDAGYTKWGAPDKPGSDEKKKCGAMFFSGYLHDMSCESRCHFICEHNLGDDNSFDLDERFNTY